MLQTVAIPASTVNERPAIGRLLALGFQHVLVMYAGNVAVPLLVAEALKLPPDQTAFLINSGLFAAGIATLIQSLGIGRFGARLPVMMGATFLTIAPMIAMGLNPGIGLPGFHGALLVSGLLGMLIAPLIGRFLPLFPAVVTGSLVTLIGISLLSVAMNWAAGGNPTDPKYGEITGLSVALFVFIVILLLTKYARGIWNSLAIMLGILAGTLVAIPLGWIRIEGVAEAPWVALVEPFHFGMPTFHAGAIVTMGLVMIITLVESTAVFLALADITGSRFTGQNLTQALRADGLGMLAGGIFNAFPCTTFSQNVGLVTVTGVRSRFVCATGGVILMALGLLPKLAHVVAAVPQQVLGGAGIVMFGMVAAAGVRILSAVDFQGNRHNLFIVASSMGFGMIPTLSPRFFQHLPDWTSPITSSGVVLGTLVAVILNLVLNGSRVTHSV
ncbi:MAG: pbuX5 [Bryobacterales bacterium]|nr:pbuX5 [Bryobacterales bacterium]